jgi:hypothetical protein
MIVQVPQEWHRRGVMTRIPVRDLKRSLPSTHRLILSRRRGLRGMTVVHTVYVAASLTPSQRLAGLPEPQEHSKPLYPSLAIQFLGCNDQRHSCAA